jgi:hypothetical protein
MGSGSSRAQAVQVEIVWMHASLLEILICPVDSRAITLLCHRNNTGLADRTLQCTAKLKLKIGNRLRSIVFS